LAPLGLGDELRVALISGGHCWGVLCLHRADAIAGFDDDDVTLLRRLAPKLAEGLRRGVALAGAAPAPSGHLGPGIVVIDSSLSVASINRDAERWIAQLDLGAPRAGCELPDELSGAAARVLHTHEAVTVRLRRTGGGWITVHASPMHGAASQVALVLEAAADTELSSLLLAALGLTPAQSRVASLVLRGRSTREITNALEISANTVQEHLRAIFDKLGIGSRRELVAVLTGRARGQA
jgi:DNA-binding CsgD family transcriptional regulator